MKCSTIRLGIVLGTMLFTSCDKPKRLQAETEALDAKRATVLQESDGYLEKLKSLTASGKMHPSQLERSAKDVSKKAEEKEVAAASKLAKWEAIAAELKIVQVRVESWKAKYLK